MGMKDIVTLRQIKAASEHKRHQHRTVHKWSLRSPPRRLAGSVTDAAAMLGISGGLAYELVHRGELPVLRRRARLRPPADRITAPGRPAPLA